MRKRKWLWRGIILLLYAVTWIGGWITHARDLAASTQAKYQRMEERNVELAAEARVEGFNYKPIPLHKGGPVTGVNWCLPLLPGVLLADSYYSCGPLAGKGTIKIVVYWGTGSAIVCDLAGWIA